MSPRLQFPLFDSLRAVAAISILVVHVALFSAAPLLAGSNPIPLDLEPPLAEPWYGRFVAHLDVGVPFFFLLSAFLLYRPFVAARVSGAARDSFAAYARRRFVRVMPAYWAALTVAAIIPGVAGAFSGDWWVYYGLLQNYPVFTPDGMCAVNPYRCGIPTAWSLAIEVFFYASLPFFVLAMDWIARRFGGRNWLMPELAVIAAIAAVSIWIQSSVPRSDLELWLFFSPLGRGWWFGLGLALAAISVHAAQRGSRGWNGLRFAGWAELSIAAAIALYLLASLFLLEPAPGLAFPIGNQLTYTVEYLLAGVIAALVVLPAIFEHRHGGLYRRLLAHPWLTWLGLVSYGIFLWQFPVMLALIEVGILGVSEADFLVLLGATLAVTVACAAASYYLIELPLKRRFRSRHAPATPAEAVSQSGASGL